MQPNDPSSAPLGGLGAATLSSMFQSVDGLRNRPALIAWVGCVVVGVLVAGLLAALSSTLGLFAVLLAAIVFLAAFGTGVNAAGVLQMDQARGVPLRSLADALVYGLTCIPKLIVLGLAFFAVTLVFFLALALVFAVCRIPFVGPILYTVVFPLAVVATGLLMTGVFACMLLSLPAIWEGSPIARALAQTFAIARSRLVETLLLFAVVGVLCIAVAFVVFGVLFNGLVPVLVLSGALLPTGGDMGGLGGGGMLGSLTTMSAGGAGGYVAAGGIGFVLLWSVAGALVGQVYLHGLNLVYLRVTEGLDVGAAEALLQRKIDEAKQRSGELAAKARAAAAPAPSADDHAADEARAAKAAAAAAAAAYGGHANPPPAYSPAPADVPRPPAFAPPPSPMASPPAYSAPPVTRPTFDFPASMGPTASSASSSSSSMPPAMPTPRDSDLPGAVEPVLHVAPSLIDAPLNEQGAPTGFLSPSPTTPEPLDLEFDFDLPGTSSPAASTLPTPSTAGGDPAPTMPLRGARDSLSGSTAASANSTPPATAPVVPPFPTMATPAEPPAAMTVTCPKCLSAASPDDVFCGVCGNRLK